LEQYQLLQQKFKEFEVYVCVCVCVYVCVCVCMCVCVYVYFIYLHVHSLWVYSCQLESYIIFSYTHALIHSHTH